MQNMTWLELGLTIYGVVLATATPFIVIYARKAAQGIAGLRDVTLTDEQLRQVDHWVSLAIAFVDEQVRKFAKGTIATAPQTAEEKRQLAVKVARDLAPDDLRQFTDAKLEMVVDAKVQDRRVSLLPAPSARVPSLPPLPSASALDAGELTGRHRRP